MGLKRIRRTFSFTYTIIIYFSLVTLLTIALLLYFIIQKIEQYNFETTLKNLSKTIFVVEDTIKKNGSDYSKVKFISEIMDLNISILDIGGILLYDTHADDISALEKQYFHEEIVQAVNNNIGYSQRFSSHFGEKRIYYAIKSKGFIVRISTSMKDINATLNKIVQAIIMSGLILLSFVIFINYVISRRITKPIMESINFAEHFSQKDFSQRIQSYSNNDIGILQRSLNKLADSLEIHIHDLIFERNKMNATINHITDAIAVIGMDNKILLANSAFSKLFELSESPESKSYFEVIRSSRLNTLIDEIQINNEDQRIELRLQSGRICEIALNPIKGATNFRGILIVLHDITQKKEVDRIKTELVGNLSHELKTPIAILKGYLETIEIHIDNKEMSLEFIQKSLVNLERQNHIINDMLKLNMLETGGKFDLTPLNLPSIIENCCNILAPKIQSRKLKITTQYHDKDLFIKGNKFLAEQIFFNLITNAINYNVDQGDITIESRFVNDKLVHKNFVVYSVIDSGIGIPEESVERIFERFYRVDKGRSRSAGGTGLGLAIVKHSAELQQWAIAVQPRDVGTAFHIKIPFM